MSGLDSSSGISTSASIPLTLKLTSLSGVNSTGNTLAGSTLTLRGGDAFSGGSTGSASGGLSLSTPNAAAGAAITAYTAGALNITVGNAAALGAAQAVGSGITFTAGSAASGVGGAAASGGGFVFKTGAPGANGGNQGLFLIQNSAASTVLTVSPTAALLTMVGTTATTVLKITTATSTGAGVPSLGTACPTGGTPTPVWIPITDSTGTIRYVPGF